LLLGANGSKCPPSPQVACKDLDFNRYKGFWYEQTTSKSFPFELGLQCVTANYSMNADGTVKVLNTGTKGSPTGDFSVATGAATIKDESKCLLSVSFSKFAPNSDYQIIDTDYDNYAIVTTCLPEPLNSLKLSSVFILGRVPKLPQTTVEGLVAKLKNQGFDYSDMKYQVQTDDCKYTKDMQSTLASTAGTLVTFDGAAGTTFKFTELNDPVMGGKSTGTWTLGQGFGIMDGEVVNVPALKAPGFIKAAADGSFPDISEFIGGSLVLTVRTSTPDYSGFRVTFVSGAASPSFSCAGGGSLPFSRGCYKQKFTVPAGTDFVEVKLPFNTFSDKWSSATGEHTEECKNNSDVCPTASKLSKIQRIEFWGEGSAGKLHLEIKSVSAEKASGARIALV